MADISKITLPSGTTYDIKDAVARSAIDALGSYAYFIGVTTTALTDGATANPIVVGGNNVTAKIGGIATYGSAEFVWNGTAWQAFGDLSALGALAFKDSTSATYTPAGTVSQPTFTGTQGTVSVSGTPSGSVTITSGTTGTTNYAPAGSVSQPTFTGTALTSTGNFTPSGNVAITAGTTGTANYTPAGTVSQPTTTVTLNTTTVNSITAVGTLPSCTLPTLSTSVANETLTLSWTEGSFSAGTLPTKGNNTTVATSVKSATTTQPTFTGTGAVLSAAFTGTQGSVSVSGTPAGTVSKPTFTGTGAVLSGSFTGSALTSTGDFTPSGTVSKPTFTGTQATITGS